MIGLLLTVVLFASAFVLTVDVKAEVPDVQELAEYTQYLHSGDIWHFIIVHNNSTKHLTIMTNTVAYDATGGVSGADTGYYDDLAPGCDGLIIEQIDCISKPVSYQTQFSSKKSVIVEDSTPYVIVQTNVSDDHKKVVATFTNIGTVPASQFDIVVLFMKGTQVLDYSYAMPVDLDGELKPGYTLSDTVSYDYSENPDNVLIFPQGCHYN